jgi:hypothetical protein
VTTTAVATAVAGAPAESPEPVVTPAVRPSAEVLSGVHPAIAADVLRRAQGDVRRLRVLSPTRVLVMNRPCEE